MTNRINDILGFFKIANKLKGVRRYKTSLGKGGDSTADHSWSLALLVLLVGENYKNDLNLDRAIKLALIHDLPESVTDDVDAYDQITGNFPKSLKVLKENEAMKDIAKGGDFGHKVFELWKEYENQKTLESRFVKALDKIEAFIHLSEGGIKHYKQKEFFLDYADEIIKTFDDSVKCFPILSNLLLALKAVLENQLKVLKIEWKK